MRTEYSEKYITMGLKIAYYRKKAGYTQESFAEKIGKSVNFISQIEGTGTVRGVSLETLITNICIILWATRLAVPLILMPSILFSELPIPSWQEI